MIRSTVLSALVIVAITATVRAEEKYESKDGKFNITFTDKPKETTKEIPTAIGKITLYMTTVEAGKDKVFIATYNDYPDAVSKSPPQDVLKGVRDGAKGKDGKVLDDKEITFGDDKIPGREYTLQKGTLFHRYRVFLNGTRLYNVGYVAPTKDDLSSKEADAFFESFKITK
jgi:hypothetical protein